MTLKKLNEHCRRIKQNLPELAFLLFSMRLIILGSSIGDALALVSIAGVLAFRWYLNKGKDLVTQELLQDMEEIKKSLSALKIDKIVKQRVPSNEPQKEKRYF